MKLKVQLLRLIIWVPLVIGIVSLVLTWILFFFTIPDQTDCMIKYLQSWKTVWSLYRFTSTWRSEDMLSDYIKKYNITSWPLVSFLNYSNGVTENLSFWKTLRWFHVDEQDLVINKDLKRVGTIDGCIENVTSSDFTLSQKIYLDTLLTAQCYSNKFLLLIVPRTLKMCDEWKDTKDWRQRMSYNWFCLPLPKETNAEKK